MPEKVSCGNFESLAVLYAAGEMEAPSRAAVEEHARACADCAARLQSEMTMAGLFAAGGRGELRQDPHDLLLARCRSRLGRTLDAEDDSPRGWRQWLRPRNLAAAFGVSVDFHPGWSVAALLLVAAVSGWAGWEGVGRVSVKRPAEPLMTISATPPVTDQELATMGIERLSWQPQENGSPTVEVQMRTDRPVVLRGSPDDSDIRRVLAYVVKSGARFDSGMRLDSLELLRSQAADPRVNQAIRQAAEDDPNPAVRLRALESLRDLAADPEVRDTMLQALARDDNSGVRVEAVNGLLAAMRAARTPSAWLDAGGGGDADAGALQILRDRMHNDPNNYVRLRSATALAQLASARGDLATAGTPAGAEESQP
jgi:HEAT repeats/Putative zinc-finger